MENNMEILKDEYYEYKSFKGEKLVKTVLEDCEFIDCEFEDCIFEECNISKCNFVNCEFYNCKIINPKTNYSEIKNAKFTKCNLIGIQWNELIVTGRLSQTISKFKDCYLKYNIFMDMNFVKFDFSENEIQDSMFEACNLMESKFKNCRLESTQILKSDIRKADFRGARGYLIDITTNKMKDARFSLPEAISLLNNLGIKID